MAIMTGKFINGVALESRFRLIFIPLVKRNGVISCLKVRNYGSSVPVRYIPKHSPKTQRPLSVPPKKDSKVQDKHNHSDPKDARAEISDGSEVLRRSYMPEKSTKTVKSKNCAPCSSGFEDKDNINSSDSRILRIDLMDNVKNKGRSCALGEKLNHNHRSINYRMADAKAEVEEEIEEDECLEITEELVRGLTGKEASEKLVFQSGKTNKDAENMAIEFLSRRALTTMELRKKLIAKRYPLHVVDEVIADFQIRGLLDDFQYAEAFSRSRFSTLSWGPGRIKQALYRKGVSDADADKAIKLVFKDRESGEDDNSSIGLSKPSLDHLFVQASKQWVRGQSVPSDKRKSNIIQWLRYRGFNWGVVNVVLKKLELEYPS